MDWLEFARGPALVFSIAVFVLGVLLDTRLAFAGSGALFVAAGVLAVRRGRDIRVDTALDGGVSLLPGLEDRSPETSARKGMSVGIGLILWGLGWVYIGLSGVR